MKTAFGKLLIAFATSSSTLNNCNVTIQWTSKDVVSMRYELERKAPGDASFSKIADISAKPGDVLSTQSYQHTHVLSNVPAGTIQFRIRQVIDTSTSSFTALYVDTTNVNLPSTCFTTGVNNNPNIPLKISVVPNPSGPASGELILEGDQQLGNLVIEIIDAQGRSLKKLYTNKRAGRQSMTLPNDLIPAGNYWINIYQKDQRIGTIRWTRLP